MQPHQHGSPLGPVDFFLHFLHDNPSLLPPVKAAALEKAMGGVVSDDTLVQWRVSCGHMCLKCGREPAGMALIAAHPLHGRRWLDVCPPCLTWLKGGMHPG